MIFTVEVLDFGDEDSLTVQEELSEVFVSLGLVGVLHIGKTPFKYYGDKAFINKARAICSILKERAPEQLKEEYYTADLLIDVVYPSGHIEAHGVRLKDPMDIDFYEAITQALTDFDYSDMPPKEKLLDVKEGKIYDLSTGKMVQKFYIKNGKIGFRKKK